MTLLEELEALLSGPTSRRLEERALAALASAADLELATCLDKIDVARLVSEIDDHTLGPKHRARLREILCRERVGTLSVTVRSRLVAALQAGRTCARDEEAIAQLFIATKGDDLWQLKALHDASESYRDLCQLVFRDFDAEHLRTMLLDHFAGEAARLSADQRITKVISDIDDTLWANWKDRRYPKKTVYPGARAFYEALARTNVGPRHAHVTFLTARPRDRAGIIETRTRKTLSSLGIEGATVLTGPLRKVLSNNRIAAGKLRGFLDYRSVYPEADFVFVGDSGQGDVTLGLSLYERARAVIRGVFIHDVIDTSERDRTRLAAQGIHLFDTYVGAAARAMALGLLERDGAETVARHALAELSRLRFDDDAQEVIVRRLFDRDATKLAS